MCPVHGVNELDDDVIKEIRAELGGRRGKKRNTSPNGSADNNKKKRSQR